MFSVKLKVKEDPRSYYSLPRRRKSNPSSSFSSSTSSLSRLQAPKKSSFLSNTNGTKNNKKVRIQTSYEQSSLTSLHGRWTESLWFYLFTLVSCLRKYEMWKKEFMCIDFCCIFIHNHKKRIMTEIWLCWGSREKNFWHTYPKRVIWRWLARLNEKKKLCVMCESERELKSKRKKALVMSSDDGIRARPWKVKKNTQKMD